jgi:peptide/nickel transport system substrate-binding protein
VTSNENTEIAQLRSGELDMAMTVSPVAAAQLGGIERIHVVASPINGYFGLLFNTRRVADVRVRRAIAEGIDASAVRAQIAHGFDRPAVADLPAFLWAFPAGLHPLAYDVSGARALMHSAGYGPGRPFPLDLAIIAGRRTDEAWAVLLQATLARIDVAVHIRSYAAPVYGGTVSENGILATGRFDATIYYFIAGTDPDDSSQFLCDQRPPAGYNVAFYCNADMDAAQRVALGSYTRPARKAAYRKIETYLLRDVPIVFVGSPTDVTAMRSGITGFAPNPVTPSAAAERWSLGPP